MRTLRTTIFMTLAGAFFALEGVSFVGAQTTGSAQQTTPTFLSAPELNTAQQSNTQAAQTPATVNQFMKDWSQANKAAQQAQLSHAPTTQPNTNTEDKVYGKLKCLSWSGVVPVPDITGCIAIGVYNLLYRPASFLLEGAGYLLDQMLSLSIEGPLVVPNFINYTWMIARDFANMLFIFVLLYAGISTMIGSGDWMRTIRNVIIVALLINFSLFFSKVIIDAGNVLAVGIKDSMIIPGESISVSLAHAFSPQVFLSTAGEVKPGNAIVVFFVAIIVSVFVAYVFFKVAILFSRRLIVFWALMILSPLAFISLTLPGKWNRFQDWLNEMVSQAFIAPVFLFLMYLIMQVINAPAPNGGKLLDLVAVPGNSWFTKLLGPVIVAALLIKALQEALKFTENFAGSTGEGFSNLVTKGLGLAVAAPTIAGAVAGGVVGGVGKFASFAAQKGFGGGAGGALDKFGKGTQTVGKGIATTGEFLDLHKLPKKISKVPVIGGVAGYAAKTGLGTLGIPNVLEELKGGEKGKEASKAKKKAEGNKAALEKFRVGAGLPAGDKRGLDDPAVVAIINQKKDALELAEANAEALLATTSNFSPNYADAVVARNRARRDLKEFEQKHSKAKDIEKELKEE